MLEHSRTMSPLNIFLINMDGVGDLKSSEKKDSQEFQVAWWQPAITMFLKLSVWIAAPVIIALYLGEWLDKKYQTGPWLFLVCIGMAFIISIAGLVRNTLAEYKKIEKVGGGKEK